MDISDTVHINEISFIYYKQKYLTGYYSDISDVNYVRYH